MAQLENIEIKVNGALVWTYSLSYEPSPDTERLLLKSIQLSAPGDADPLPAKTFTYQRLEP